jgi:hypothetical protein
LRINQQAEHFVAFFISSWDCSFWFDHSDGIGRLIDVINCSLHPNSTVKNWMKNGFWNSSIAFWILKLQLPFQ